MLIDWFTVGAQALNFLILVWLLKRYLYKPILDAIDAREKGIAQRLADAAAKMAEAVKESDEFSDKNAAFEQQRAALLRQANDEAGIERKRLIDEARQAADALRAQRQDALRSEQQRLNDEIGRRTRAEAFAIARKVLADLAGSTLEEHMSAMFVRRLHELDGDAKKTLVTALATAAQPLVVRSAFDLSPEQQNAVKNAIGELLSAEVAINFETAPGLIGGIEVRGDGQKLAWSVADYLGSLETGIAALVEDQSVRQAAPQTPPLAPAAPPRQAA